MAVSAEFKMSLSANQVGTGAFGNSAYWGATIEAALSFADGTTANKFDRLYVAERTVASGANDDLDLAGVLADAFGATITAAELAGIVVVNKAKDGTANTTTLTIGGGTNPFVGFLSGTTPAITKLGPGAVFVLISPDATGLGTVTAGTGDVLRIANSSGASAKYQIAILARSV